MEVEFIGRHYYLGELRKSFETFCITSVCGLKTVGKSRLVREFLASKDRSDQDGCETRIISVDMHHHTDKGSLYSFLCSSLDVTPRTDALDKNGWISHIVHALQNRPDERHVIVFDNAEDAVEERIYAGFLSLLNMTIKHCINVKLIVTSTTNILFSAMGKAHNVIELPPLKDSEARALLAYVTSGVDIGGNEMDAMVKLSEGLPLLLLMIGSELTDKDRGISPRMMVEMLAEFRLEATSPECYPPERRAADVYSKFIWRLSEIYQSRLAILNFIPGSFNVREAREMLDHNTDAVTKFDTIRPLLGRHVMFRKQNWRFDIHGILRECMDTFPKISNLPEIQSRYYQLFSAVMTEVSRRIGTAEYTKALAEFSIEQPNFSKLLNQVSESTQDNYKFFIQVARDCSHLIEQYMPELSDRFYKGCLTLADRHGQTFDKATVYVAIGSLSTNGKGNFVSGEANYREALSLLEKEGKSVQLTSLYQRLGWNLHSQGRSMESLWYLQQALELCSPGAPEYQTVMMQTLNHLGIVHNWIGNYEEAKRFSTKVMSERKARLGEDHPHYAESLNQMGLIHDQIGQPDVALTYFEKALEVKRRAKTTIYSLTVSLNNMANKYRTLKQFDRARELLDEAMGNMDGSEQKHQGGVSLTHNSYGKLYRDMGQFELSDEHFKKAVDIRNSIMPRSIPYVWTLIQLAQVKSCRKKYKSALVLLDDILQDKEHILETMPHNDFVVEVLQTKADIYLAHGYENLYKDMLNETLLELARLLNIHLEKENDQKYEIVCRKWDEVKRKLDTL